MRAAQTFASELIATASVMGVRMLGAALSFALAIALSAQLGAVEAGIFYASLSWGIALALLALWGAPQLILHEIPPLLGRSADLSAGPAMRLLLIGNLVRFAAIAAILLAFTWWYSADRMLADLALDYRFAILSGLLLLILRSASEGAKAAGHPAIATTVEFVTVPGLTLLVLFAVFGASWPGYEGAFVIYVLALGAAAIAGGGFLLGKLPDWREPAVSSPKHWSARRRIFAQIEIGQFLTSIGAVAFLPLVLSTADVGVLNLVLRIAALVSLVTATIPSIYLPRLARAQAADDADTFERTLRHLRIIMAVAGSGAFAAIVLAGPVILVLAGPEFASGIAALPWAAAGFCAALAIGPAGTELTLMGRERAMRNIVLPIGLLGISASLLAGWLGGLTAAAAMPGAAALLAKVIQLFLLRRARSSQQAARS